MRIAGTLERNSEPVLLTTLAGVLAVGAISGFGAPVTWDAATVAPAATDELANIGAPFALILIGIPIINVDRYDFPWLPLVEAVELVVMAAAEASMPVESLEEPWDPMTANPKPVPSTMTAEADDEVPKTANCEV